VQRGVAADGCVCGGVCRQEIEGYLGVIDEARGALETEAERAAGLQKQVAELTTALEEKDLEVRLSPLPPPLCLHPEVCSPPPPL